MYSGKSEMRDKSDFATLNIVDDQYGSADFGQYVDPPYALGNTARPGIPADFGADYPRIIDDKGMMDGTSMDHPLAASWGMGNFGYDIFGINLSNLAKDVVAKATTEAKTVVSRVIGQTASQVLEKPAVQIALMEQAKEQAVQATAAQITGYASKAKEFFNKNKTMIIAGGIGAVVLGVVYFKFLKK